MARKTSGGQGGRRAFWRSAVERQQASGESVRGFCRGEGLAEASFYAWRRKLAGEAAETASPATGFVSLGTLRLEEGFAGVEVILDAPLRLRVGRGFDAATLRGVLAVLGEAPVSDGRGQSC